MFRQTPQSTIGTAWLGHHVITLLCNPYTNELLSLETSLSAPTEPAHPTCTETLSRLLSIGYTLLNATMISPSIIQYILIKK